MASNLLHVSHAKENLLKTLDTTASNLAYYMYKCCCYCQQKAVYHHVLNVSSAPPSDGLGQVWTRLCFSMSPAWLKAALHTSQAKGA